MKRKIDSLKPDEQASEPSFLELTELLCKGEPATYDERPGKQYLVFDKKKDYEAALKVLKSMACFNKEKEPKPYREATQSSTLEIIPPIEIKNGKPYINIQPEIIVKQVNSSPDKKIREKTAIEKQSPAKIELPVNSLISPPIQPSTPLNSGLSNLNIPEQATGTRALTTNIRNIDKKMPRFESLIKKIQTTPYKFSSKELFNQEQKNSLSNLRDDFILNKMADDWYFIGRFNINVSEDELIKKRIHLIRLNEPLYREFPFAYKDDCKKIKPSIIKNYLAKEFSILPKHIHIKFSIKSALIKAYINREAINYYISPPNPYSINNTAYLEKSTYLNCNDEKNSLRPVTLKEVINNIKNGVYEGKVLIFDETLHNNEYKYFNSEAATQVAEKIKQKKEELEELLEVLKNNNPKSVWVSRIIVHPIIVREKDWVSPDPQYRAPEELRPLFFKIQAVKPQKVSDTTPSASSYNESSLKRSASEELPPFSQKIQQAAQLNNLPDEQIREKNETGNQPFKKIDLPGTSLLPPQIQLTVNSNPSINTPCQSKAHYPNYLNNPSTHHASQQHSKNPNSQANIAQVNVPPTNFSTVYGNHQPTEYNYVPSMQAPQYATVNHNQSTVTRFPSILPYPVPYLPVSGSQINNNFNYPGYVQQQPTIAPQTIPVMPSSVQQLYTRRNSSLSLPNVNILPRPTVTIESPMPSYVTNPSAFYGKPQTAQQNLLDKKNAEEYLDDYFNGDLSLK